MTHMKIMHTKRDGINYRDTPACLQGSADMKSIPTYMYM